ncbi:MAG: DNA recombination protein RmuC [Desulfobacterium sp.]|nr:DNA recombination protein RmuC [Desulfobacterium sp.]
MTRAWSFPTSILKQRRGGRVVPLWRSGMITNENLIFLGAGFLAGLVLCMVLQRFGLSIVTRRLRSISAEALQVNSSQFLELADHYFAGYVKEAKKDLDIKGDEIIRSVDPVRHALDRYENRLGQMELDREKAFGSLTAQLVEMARTQQNLRKETGNLVKSLRLPHVRGRWGEITLRRVAELAGMADQCDFTEQFQKGAGKGALRPDMVIHLPGDRNIVVDSKVPLSAYLDALEASTREERQEKLRNHARQVQVHIKALSAKEYWKQFVPTPEFVVLFIPGENFFSAALAQKPDLIESAIEKGVVLATPATLISLLKAVSYGWRQEKSHENAKEITRIGTELFQRLSAMAGNMNRLGKDIEKVAGSYNKTVGSMESRVMVSARKLSSLGISQEEEIPPMEPVNGGTRTVEIQEETCV